MMMKFRGRSNNTQTRMIADLCLPCLFFLHPILKFKWLILFPLLSFGNVFGREFGGSWHFAEWVKGVQETLRAPNKSVLVFTPIPIEVSKSREINRKPMAISIPPDYKTVIVYYLPEIWESIPYPPWLRENFGMILIDQSAPQWNEPIGGLLLPREPAKRLPFTDSMLEYCFTALVRGGKIVITEGRKVRVVFTKNGPDNGGKGFEGPGGRGPRGSA